MPEEGQIFGDGAEAEIFEHVRGEFLGQSGRNA
jgi:hypothetical protein